MLCYFACGMLFRYFFVKIAGLFVRYNKSPSAGLYGGPYMRCANNSFSRQIYFVSRQIYFSVHKYILSVDKYILSVHKYILLVHKYILSVHKYILSVNKYILSVHKYILSVHKYILSVHKYILSVDKSFLSVHKYILSVDKYILSEDKFPRILGDWHGLNYGRCKRGLLGTQTKTPGEVRKEEIARDVSVPEQWSSQPPPPLGQVPEDRTTGWTAFEVVGTDFAGPICYRRASKREGKAYMTIFSCSLSRAVHLALVSNLETETFVQCLKCLVTRRGRLRVIYSSNGGTFVKSAKWLNQAVNDERLQGNLEASNIT